MATEIGIVVGKKNSSRGTPMLQVGSQWYVAGRVDVSSVNVGRRISFEWKEFGNDPSRPMRGIENWAFTPDQPTPQEVEAATAAAAPKSKTFGKGGGGGFRSDRSLEIDLQCMRFVGQICGGAIEKGILTHETHLEGWVKTAWKAISFTRALGGAAPAPATESGGASAAPGQTATPAGPPQQPSQGGQAPTPKTYEGGKGPRPTGLFGYGTKYKDVPWNVMEAKNLIWFKDSSNAPSDVKQQCADELWHREQEKLRADQVQQSMAQSQDPDDWDSDIPF